MRNLTARNQRLTQLRALIHEGIKIREEASLRGWAKTSHQIQQEAAAWRERILADLPTLGAPPDWCTWPEKQEFSALTIDQAVNGLQILTCRVLDERSVIIDNEDTKKIEIATRLLAFGSYLIERAQEHTHGVLVSILRAFTPFQNEDLPEALSAMQRWAQQETNNGEIWTKSIEFIRANFEAGINILALDRTLQWHLGWTMFTLGWQLTEALGDSICLNDSRCCTFEQAKMARNDYNIYHSLSCPKCETDIDCHLVPEETAGRTGLYSCFWYCETCSLAGFFPQNVRTDSAWHLPREQRSRLLGISVGTTNLSIPNSDSQVMPLASPQRTALILVAVTTERRALLAEAKEQNISITNDEFGGRYVDRFVLPGRSVSSWSVIVGQSTEKGPQGAQAAIQDFVRLLNPDLVMLVGMCGGLSEHGASEKSVIVARQVSNYEPARIRAGQTAWSPTTYRSSPRITDLANAIAARDIFPDIQIITNKDYGSGEKLIDDLTSNLRLSLLGYSGDLVGFEMEGHGMLHALWELQRNNPSIQASMIKGVSDFGDGLMRENKEARQVVATRRAVQLALEILRQY